MPLKLDALVELIDQYSSVYPRSPTGARGWVRARREMPKSDPEVYIEWDRNHWRYHGEPDGWTFEHHFRPVNENAPDPEAPSMHRVLEEAQRKLERDPALDGPPERFVNALMEAHDQTLSSEGFLIITVAPRHTRDFTLYEPKVYCETLNDAARQAIEAQLIHAAAQLYERHLLTQFIDLEGEE